MRRVIYAPEAAADILAIARRIADDNLAAAEGCIESIDTKAHLLLTVPEMGLRRDELAPGLRSFPVGNYVILYRVAKRGIEVARVFHGARDIPALF